MSRESEKMKLDEQLRGKDEYEALNLYGSGDKK